MNSIPSNANGLIVGFTGSRQLKSYREIEENILSSEYFKGAKAFVPGGALGLDTHVARYATEHDIPLYIPQ